MGLLPQDATFEELVQECFLAFRGSGLMLSALDAQLLAEWSRAGVPFEVVARGIRSAAERAGYDARPGQPALRSLRACRKDVEAEIARFQARDVGRGDDAGRSGGPPSVDAASSDGRAFPVGSPERNVGSSDGRAWAATSTSSNVGSSDGRAGVAPSPPDDARPFRAGWGPGGAGVPGDVPSPERRADLHGAPRAGWLGGAPASNAVRPNVSPRGSGASTEPGAERRGPSASTGAGAPSVAASGGRPREPVGASGWAQLRARGPRMAAVAERASTLTGPDRGDRVVALVLRALPFAERLGILRRARAQEPDAPLSPRGRRMARRFHRAMVLAEAMGVRGIW